MKTYGAVHCKDEDQQEKRKVSCSIACSEHENEAAHQHDGYRVEEEPETVLKSVTHEGVPQRPEDHEDVWRSCEEEVGHVVRVVESVSSQRGEEVLEAITRNVSIMRFQ